MNSGSRHLAREDFYATSGGIADGKDLGIRLPRRVSLSHGIIIYALIVGADRRQGHKHTTMNPYKDQAVHPVMSLIEMKRQLGTCWWSLKTISNHQL